MRFIYSIYYIYLFRFYYLLLWLSFYHHRLVNMRNITKYFIYKLLSNLRHLGPLSYHELEVLAYQIVCESRYLYRHIIYHDVFHLIIPNLQNSLKPCAY